MNQTNKSSKLGSNFWRLWSANAISGLGSGVTAVAGPWIGSSLTRNPLLIAVLSFASQLPWLIFTLPAGVLTDRFNKKRILISMDLVRAIVTALFAIVIWNQRDALGDVRHPTQIVATNIFLVITLFITLLANGFATVLFDNTSQAFLPNVVDKDALATANSRLWLANGVTESLIGPPLASLLIAIAVVVPFVFDATSFLVSALLILTLTQLTQSKSEPVERRSFKVELKEGLQWLWASKLMRTLAFTLGGLNFYSSLGMASMILFAQEVLHTSILEFGLLGTGAAIGGVIGSLVSEKIIRRFGEDTCLIFVQLGLAASSILIGLCRNWQSVWVIEFFAVIFSIIWNTITVTFRQSVIPPQLLGRVNSVYRFFGWGFMPIGALLGGTIVSIAQHLMSREYALRLPYFIAGIIGIIIYFLSRDQINGEAFKNARESAKSN
mgnify:CR=1 FL=1